MTAPHAVIYYGGFLARTGGAFMHARCLQSALEEMGWRVSVVTLDSLPPAVRYLPHLVERVVNVFRAPAGFYYKGRLTAFLFRSLFGRRADLRVFEDVYLSWNSRVPSITVLHAVWSDNLQAFALTSQAAQNLVAREARRISAIRHPVVTVSEPYREYLLNHHFAACPLATGIDVIELGVDVRKFAAPAALRPARSIIYCGTLEARKNVGFLLEVFERVWRQDRAAMLTVVGDGPEREALQRRANERGLPVTFMGRVAHPDVIQQLHAHTIYVHTSVKESFSFALLEAKLCGLTTCALSSLEVPAPFIDIRFDRLDADTWASGILQIASPSLLESFPDFSAERMARRTLSMARVKGGEVASPPLAANAANAANPQ